jgi:hypothetical protein
MSVGPPLKFFTFSLRIACTAGCSVGMVCFPVVTFRNPCPSISTVKPLGGHHLDAATVSPMTNALELWSLGAAVTADAVFWIRWLGGLPRAIIHSSV